MPLSRPAEAQPPVCTCSVTSPRRCLRHRGHYDPFPPSGDLVPGYDATEDGHADAADQARWDGA
jgi:hypothetical protein